MTVERTDPPLSGDERATLVGFLDWHRDTLAFKCEGLTDEQLRLQSSPPSTLSLLGLVRHMAEVERTWFRRRFMDIDCEDLYSGDDSRGHDPDADLHPTDSDTVDEALRDLREEINFATSSTAGVPMDTLTKAEQASKRIPDWRPTLRFIVVHMIEEYARHCGHADLLRQAADGATGD